MQIPMRPGPWFNIMMTFYQYRKSHCGDKTILRPSYLHNGISYAGKMTSLYWIRALDLWWTCLQCPMMKIVETAVLSSHIATITTQLCAASIVKFSEGTLPSHLGPFHSWFYPSPVMSFNRLSVLLHPVWRAPALLDTHTDRCIISLCGDQTCRHRWTTCNFLTTTQQIGHKGRKEVL